MKKRKFSFPYNATNPTIFLEELDKRKEYIDNVYVGIPFLVKNHLSAEMKEQIDDYSELSHRFLLASRGKYKRLLTINSGCYMNNTRDMLEWCDRILLPYIEEVSLDGCIVTDYNMCKYIHECLPKLELHTSCNCFQWNIRQMELWRDKCGISVFNPPREILRTPSKLKEMHDNGFKLKCLINEGCLYGCPQTINHCMAYATDTGINTNCIRDDISNFFRGNWVIPRWLDILDEYVDIYKLAGRHRVDMSIFSTLDNYIRGEEVNDIRKILIGGVNNYAIKYNVPISYSIIPDKLLTCECKECRKTCFICDNLAKKYFK